MKNNRLFPKGFTLIEMLIVVFIILLVLTISGNTYNNQRKYVRFTDSIVKMMSLINTARTYTMTSRSVLDLCQTLPEDQVYVPKEGYGIYISRSDTPGLSRVVLFANTKAGTEMEINQFNEVADPCASDLIEEDYYLPVDTDFVKLSKDDSGTPVFGLTNNDRVVIFFRPPLADAVITINEDTPPVSADDLVKLEDLYMQFRRPESDASVPSQYIHISRIGGFPESETK